jgi:hypothetical protein
MNFIFADEQLELRAIVRDFLADKSPEDAVRRLMATPSGSGRCSGAFLLSRAKTPV